MNKTQDKKENYLDQGFSKFIRQYKYEILASFGLVSLLGGITLAALIFRQTPEEITISPTETEADDNQIIWVDVNGAVVNPGTYQLNKGSRVKDLLDMAGGTKESADSDWVGEYLNLAEVIEDGGKIYIPFKKDSDPGAAIANGNEVSKAKTNKVSLNRASLEELISLPGIGPAYAQKIIDARPFHSIDELLEVSGIGPKRFEQIKDRITVF